MKPSSLLHIGSLKSRLPLAATAVAALLLAAGCINGNSECPEDQRNFDPDANTWLSVMVTNTETSTRAANAPTYDGQPDDEGHPDEPATAAENYIDPSDFTVMLFDGGTTPRLLKLFEGEDVVITPEPSSTANKTYNLRLKVNRAYFDMCSTGDGFVSFSLLAVANASGIDNNHGNFSDYVWKSSLFEIAGAYISFDYNPTASWQPFAGTTPQKAAIPMSGLKHFTDKTLDAIAGASTPETALDLGQLPMQRAMAKIRIIDRIKDVSAQKNNSITAARIQGINIKGAYIPWFRNKNDNSWGNGTTVVHNPTVTLSETAWFSNDAACLTTTYPNTYTAGTKSYNTLLGYLPEANIKNASNDAKLVITTKSAIDGKTTFEFPLREVLYNTETDQIDNIVRNHIYEFIITAPEKSNISVMYTVCNWDRRTSGDISFN